MSLPRPPILGEPLPVELANTLFARRGHEYDGLESPEDLSAWLRALGDRLSTIGGAERFEGITTGDVDVARSLRGALRTLIAGQVGGATADSRASDTVSRVARGAPHWREFEPGGELTGVVRTRARPVIAALGQIADEAIVLLSGPDAARLRSCAAPGCIRYFRKDHPRRSCCTPRCSDRVRAARHYARRTSRDSS
jgi:predicted RNA-binding Zn ribbon-like protein